MRRRTMLPLALFIIVKANGKIRFGKVIMQIPCYWKSSNCIKNFIPFCYRNPVSFLVLHCVLSLYRGNAICLKIQAGPWSFVLAWLGRYSQHLHRLSIIFRSGFKITCRVFNRRKFVNNIKIIFYTLTFIFDLNFLKIMKMFSSTLKCSVLH